MTIANLSLAHKKIAIYNNARNNEMNGNLTKILKLASNLTRPELMALNQAVVGLIKQVTDEELIKVSRQFNKGDIVSFADSSNIRQQGVVIKQNQKTFQVGTTQNYSINIPATYLQIDLNPSQKLLKFRKSLLITNEDRFEVLDKMLGGQLTKNSKNKAN